MNFSGVLFMLGAPSTMAVELVQLTAAEKLFFFDHATSQVLKKPL